MKKTKIARAIAFTIAGTALSAGAVSTASAASITMYNLYRANFAGYTDPDNELGPAGAIFTATSTIPCAPCSNFDTDPIGPDNGSGNSTDGWVWSANPDGPNTSPPFGQTAAAADPNRPGWVGIGGSSTPTLTTPFGYASRPNLNWAVEMQGYGTAQISNADAIARYSQSADIDTAKGSWSDNAQAPNASGWKHDTDWGLFKSDVAGYVTLNIAGVNLSGTNFGFTIFKGISPNTTGTYSHHGGWNGALTPIPVSGNRNTTTGAVQLVSTSVPGQTGFTIANIVAYSVADNPLTPAFDAQNLNQITFYAEAGQVYSIALGGYRNGSWNTTNDGYVLNISQAATPPVCKFTATGAPKAVPKAPPLLNGLTFEVDALATGSAIYDIRSLTCQKTTNIDVAGMQFSPAASTGPVGTPPVWTFPDSSTLQVTARRAATGSSGTLACTIQDSSGNVCWTDPIIEEAVRVKGQPVTIHILDGGQPLSANYQYVGVKNGSQGLSALEFNVNGKKYKLTALKNNAIYYLNIGSALRADVPNEVTMTAKGKPDSSASVFVSDEPLQLQ